MKRERTSFEALPGDGNVRLAPGSWLAFHTDTPFAPTLEQLLRWMLVVRGAVLSDVFGLENELILAQLAEKFGTTDQGKVGANFFEHDQRFRARYSLDGKIKAVKPVIRRFFGKVEADLLIQDLAYIRTVRNLMAHQPCWLEPVNDSSRQRTVGLKLFIGDSAHVWELEDKDVQEWRALVIDSRRQLNRLRHRLTGDPAPDFLEHSVATG